ncbi:MAG: glycosyltransferase family 4 protein [Acidimicrobiales bacterium]
MRVAVVAPPWVAVPPPAYGGTELVLDSLCRALSGAGHDVLLCTTGDSTCPVERAWTYEAALGTDGAGPAQEMHHVIAAYEAIRAWRPDIVHDHTLFGPFYADRYPELTVVTTNHGPFEGELASLYRAVADRVAVLAISSDQASRASGLLPLAVVHHGVDVASYPVGDGGGGYALCLGRMCPDKGIRAAVEVARAAGAPLRIAAKAAEPLEQAYFAAEVEPLLGGNIEYLGEVGGDEKLELLGGAACLLNPIQWPEPFGMVMIEALACGTPVVGTPWGAAPEIVDDGVTGYLRDDHESLVTALGQVPDLDRRACRAAAEERFSSTRMAADHVRAYAAALSRTPVRAA